MTCSAASTAPARVSAATTATTSPTKRTFPVASGGRLISGFTTMRPGATGTSRSAALKTPATPGRPAAPVVSTAASSAWATVDRTKARCRTPGMSRSSTYSARPNRMSGSSRRGTALPRSEPWVAITGRAYGGPRDEPAFLYRNRAEKERRFGRGWAPPATGVRLPGYGGKGTPVRDGPGAAGNRRSFTGMRRKRNASSGEGRNLKEVVNSSFSALSARLPGLMARDQDRLRRQLDRARGLKDRAAQKAILDEVAAAVEAAEQKIANRRAGAPVPRYPAGLPVSERKDEIARVIAGHQVVIVAGETGSGKSTQLPKICLEAGRGVRGMIGHTQPRRLAARAVAERVAEELGSEVGQAVGYAVRFTDRVSQRTLVKVMTDGILLNEIQRDRMLFAYDTIIVDEAHERSLNIDFILGYLKQLLPRRPDLKVIVTSATIDTERFSRHFGGAPIVEVSGRTYPVELRYRPLVDPAARSRNDDGDGEPEERDQIQGIVEAVAELVAERPGDILVFLSGEREIRDTADALAALGLPDTELLPLYARLSAAEQHRVFESHPGRRIVLATNVAETSLTVPGILSVVDPGTARISRYSHRTKVQRLPIEPVSQASSNQRAGRCGRVAPGVCIRLYSETDFRSRPEFTEPEIVRTNLASVILQMSALGLGDVARFPFVDAPDARSIKDGVALLEELGALDAAALNPKKRLTPLGRRLAQLPLDPRLGRMVLEAEANGCLEEVMVIAAALSIQDPRERPLEKQAAAAESHARFADRESDFMSYLRLWEYLQERQDALSSNQFRKLCRAEFLNFLRIREWQDIHGQLRQVMRSLDGRRATGPSPSGRPDAEPHDEKRRRKAIHQSLLAGLLSHIGMKSGPRDEYQGARAARFAIAPGSVLFKSGAGWVMAAELVETTRLWARVVARIE